MSADTKSFGDGVCRSVLELSTSTNPCKMCGKCTNGACADIAKKNDGDVPNVPSSPVLHDDKSSGDGPCSRINDNSCKDGNTSKTDACSAEQNDEINKANISDEISECGDVLGRREIKMLIKEPNESIVKDASTVGGVEKIVVEQGIRTGKEIVNSGMLDLQLRDDKSVDNATTNQCVKNSDSRQVETFSSLGKIDDKASDKCTAKTAANELTTRTNKQSVTGKPDDTLIKTETNKSLTKSKTEIIGVKPLFNTSVKTHDANGKKCASLLDHSGMAVNEHQMKRRKLAPLTTECLIPFQKGWKREVVIRATQDESKRRSSDIYYYTPTHEKLRSGREIEEYLKKHPEFDLSPECFTFRKCTIHNPPAETVRFAKQNRAKPDITKVTSPSNGTKKNCVVIKKEVTIPKNSEKLTISSLPKNRPKKLLLSKKLNKMINARWPRKKIRKWKESVEEKTCSLSCPGLAGVLPSLHCRVCLCLFHPSCIGFKDDSQPFTCKKCVSEGRGSKVHHAPLDVTLRPDNVREPTASTSSLPSTPALPKLTVKSPQKTTSTVTNLKPPPLQKAPGATASPNNVESIKAASTWMPPCGIPLPRRPPPLRLGIPFQIRPNIIAPGQILRLPPSLTARPPAFYIGSSSSASNFVLPLAGQPVNIQPVSLQSVSVRPVSIRPVSIGSVSIAPVSVASVSAAPVSAAPVSTAPVSTAPVSTAPVSAASVSAGPASAGPASAGPASAAPASAAPASAAPASAAPASVAPVSVAPVSVTPISVTPISIRPIYARPAYLGPQPVRPASVRPDSFRAVSVRPTFIRPTPTVPGNLNSALTIKRNSLLKSLSATNAQSAIKPTMNATLPVFSESMVKTMKFVLKTNAGETVEVVVPFVTPSVETGPPQPEYIVVNKQGQSTGLMVRLGSRVRQLPILSQTTRSAAQLNVERYVSPTKPNDPPEIFVIDDSAKNKQHDISTPISVNQAPSNQQLASIQAPTHTPMCIDPPLVPTSKDSSLTSIDSSVHSHAAKKPRMGKDQINPTKSSIQWLHGGVTALTRIFEFLNHGDLCRASSVCKTWNLVTSQPHLWLYVHLDGALVYDWEALAKKMISQRSSRLNMKKMLTFEDRNRTWHGFAAVLQDLSHLTHVDFGPVPVSILHTVANALQNLQHLTAEWVTDICRDKKTLVSVCRLDVGKFGQLKSLKTLRLRGVHGIQLLGSGNRSLNDLERLQKLTHLSLTSLKDVPVTELDFVGSLKNLTILELGDCLDWTYKMYESIQCLHGLKKLRLECCNVKGNFALSAALSALPVLQHVELYHFYLDETILKTFERLRNLKWLSLWPNPKEQYQGSIINTLVFQNVHTCALLKSFVWGVLTVEVPQKNEEDAGNSKLPNDDVINISDDEDDGGEHVNTKAPQIPLNKECIPFSLKRTLDGQIEHPPDLLSQVQLASRVRNLLPQTECSVYPVQSKDAWKLSHVSGGIHC